MCFISKISQTHCVQTFPDLPSSSLSSLHFCHLRMCCLYKTVWFTAMYPSDTLFIRMHRCTAQCLWRRRTPGRQETKPSRYLFPILDPPPLWDRVSITGWLRAHCAREYPRRWVLLTLPPPRNPAKHYSCRCVPSNPVYKVLRTEPSTSCMLGKYFINSATFPLPKLSSDTKNRALRLLIALAEDRNLIPRTSNSS